MVAGKSNFWSSQYLKSSPSSNMSGVGKVDADKVLELAEVDGERVFAIN